MSTLPYAVSDSMTMLRRDFRHLQRYPVMTISGIVMPTFMLLLFVYIFGGAIGATTGGNYVNYLVPGILAMTVGAAGASTAVNVSTDMTKGIINRFRTMAISRASVLTGQVIGSVLRTSVAIALVFAVALAVGFRPNASPIEWVAAICIIGMLTIAFTWLAVAFGLVAKGPEGANAMSLPLQFLPFLSSAFVVPATMPIGVRWFVENQPFTPIIDTLRGLLTGTAIGASWAIAVGWCVSLSLIGYLWARSRYDRRRSR